MVAGRKWQGTPVPRAPSLSAKMDGSTVRVTLPPSSRVGMAER